MVSKVKILVCNNGVLSKHPLYCKYKMSLHNISLKDYPKDNYFRLDIDGIDLDQYEKDNYPQHNDMTMDAVVGIADYANNRIVKERLLLIELRMKYQSTNTLKVQELDNKICHSRSIIGSSIQVDDESLFVFNDKVAELAKKWMFVTSKENSVAVKWVAISPIELDNMLQSQSSIPYQPMTDMTDSDNQMAQLIATKNLEKLLDHIHYWHKVAEDFKREYQNNEAEHIMRHLHDKWQLTKNYDDTLDSEQKGYVEVIEEDYPYLK